MKKRYDVLYTRDAVALFLFNDIILELHSLPKKVGNIYKKLLRRAGKVFVITQSLKTLLKEKIKIESDVIPDGVDLKLFQNNVSKRDARNKLGIKDNKKIIMYTGHLYPWKGVHTLAKAAKNLPEYTFMFIGGTENDAKHFREQYEEVKNIEIINHVEHAQIPTYLKAADIVVLPNSAKSRFSTHFTSPLKLFEYMAAGIPIIASDLPTIREVISDDSAFFFQADDHNHLSKVINDVMSSIDDAQKKASIASEVVKDYTWNKRAEIILNTMNNTI